MAVTSTQIVSGGLSAGYDGFQKEEVGFFDKWNQINVATQADDKNALAGILI
jgi:hypothetical protein